MSLHLTSSYFFFKGLHLLVFDNYHYCFPKLLKKLWKHTKRYLWTVQTFIYNVSFCSRVMHITSCLNEGKEFIHLFPRCTICWWLSFNELTVSKSTQQFLNFKICYQYLLVIVKDLTHLFPKMWYLLILRALYKVPPKKFLKFL